MSSILYQLKIKAVTAFRTFYEVLQYMRNNYENKQRLKCPIKGTVRAENGEKERKTEQIRGKRRLIVDNCI